MLRHHLYLARTLTRGRSYSLRSMVSKRLAAQLVHPLLRLLDRGVVGGNAGNNERHFVGYA